MKLKIRVKELVLKINKYLELKGRGGVPTVVDDSNKAQKKKKKKSTKKSENYVIGKNNHIIMYCLVILRALVSVWLRG